MHPSYSLNVILHSHYNRFTVFFDQIQFICIRNMTETVSGFISTGNTEKYGKWNNTLFPSQQCNPRSYTTKLLSYFTKNVNM